MGNRDGGIQGVCKGTVVRQVKSAAFHFPTRRSQQPSITADPENLMAINTLAGMGILTEDESLVDAALSEIQSLSIERRQELDPRRDVTYLLVQHHLGQAR